MKSGLSARSSRVEPLLPPVAAPPQLPLDVLADEPPERLQPQLRVGAQAGEGPGVHALRLGRREEGLQVGLDLLPGELVPDPPREVADLEEVEEALQPDRPAALADGHLQLGGVGHQEQLGQRIRVRDAFGQEPLEQRPRPRVLAAEGPGGLGAEGLQVEEVEVEEPVEGREVARLLDEGAGEGRLEDVALGQPDLGRRLQGVQRLGRGDADFGAPEVADELENPLVHLAGGESQPLPPGPPHLGVRARRPPCGGSGRRLTARVTGQRCRPEGPGARGRPGTAR